VDGKYNLLLPALGIIAALLLRLIYASESKSPASQIKNQPSKQELKVSGEMCAECGLDRIPANRRKCGQCGSVNFRVSPHVKICGYCRTPNGKFRDTCVSCYDSI